MYYLSKNHCKSKHFKVRQSYLQTQSHLELRFHVLQHHTVVAAQSLFQLHSAAGLFFLPGPTQVAHDALEFVRQSQLRLLLDLKTLLRTLTLDAGRALELIQ